MNWIVQFYTKNDNVFEGILKAIWTVCVPYMFVFVYYESKLAVTSLFIFNFLFYPIVVYLYKKEKVLLSKILLLIGTGICVCFCDMAYHYKTQGDYYYFGLMISSFLIFNYSTKEKYLIVAVILSNIALWSTQYLVDVTQFPPGYLARNFNVEVVYVLNFLGATSVCLAYLFIFKKINEDLKNKNEQQKREAQNLSEVLLRTEKNAHIGSWNLNMNTNQLWWSDETYRLHELEIGSKLNVEEAINFYHPDDRERMSKCVEEGIATGKAWDGEFRLITAKGNEIWARAIGNYHEYDGVKRLEGSFQDITAQKLAQIAKDEFLSVVSHEMRTPLMSVIGMSEALTETPLNDDQKELSQIINQGGHSLLSLINDILDFSKIKKKELNLVLSDNHFTDFLEKSATIVKYNASVKNLEFITQFNIRNNNVRCDFDRIRQVIFNFLSNAIKFTENGSITFRVTEKNDYEFFFEFVDTGIGMSEDFIPKIFSAFEQDHNSSKTQMGTGLGMNISQILVEKMNGEINVESQLGKGTHFSFMLKLQAGTLQKKVVKAQDETLFKDIVIFYADDNQMNRKVVEKMLKKTQAKLELFENGQQIAEAVESGTDPDFILMDIQMPVLNGLDATKRIRKYELSKQLIPIPIVAFSAFSFDKDREKALNAGCNGSIPKPLKKEDLFEKITFWTKDSKKKAS